MTDRIDYLPKRPGSGLPERSGGWPPGLRAPPALLFRRPVEIGLGLAMEVLAAQQFYGTFTMDNRVPTCSIIHAFTITGVYMYVNYGLE